ncbi:MAG: hypothetical protein WAU86_12105 [Oricola sp.]
MLPRTDTIRTKKTNTCDCPVCAGLACQERPRYFAGQLLTETELNSEQAYLLAKNRLHNRYLHGYGIVCGLQVSCHDCEGWVTVHPGYALDACGNDIIACQAQDFDLIKAIRACREEKRGECDPWREPVRNRCEDVEENWCITIRYKEREGKPSTALVSCSPSTCGCESGRKGNGKQCECGGKGHTATRAVSVGACEPSRIIEGFELGVVPAPRREDSGKEDTFLSTLLDRLERLGISVDLTCLVECVESFMAFVKRGAAIYTLLQQNPFGAGSTIYRDLCRLREDMRDYLINNPRTNCTLLDRLAQVYCPPPPRTDNEIEQFVGQVTQALVEIAAILQAMLLDCICFAALPTCPGDVCEERLLLACVTVRGDRILSICHSDVRRYVLTGHTLVPALISMLLEDLCCRDLPERLPGLDTGAGFSSAAFTRATFASAFSASPGAAAAAGVASSFAASMETASAAGATLDGTNFVGRPAAEARASLKGKVSSIEVTTVSWTPGEAALRSLGAPAIRSGQPLRMYVDENKNVVGFATLSEADVLRRELDAANKRLSRLEKQVKESLKGSAAGGNK